MPLPKYAFKCRECGRLEEAENAGERGLPAACRSCGAGVRFDPRTGAKSYDDRANWIVLAELTPDELAPILDNHKLKASQIGRHVPTPPAEKTREPISIALEATESMTAIDEGEGQKS